MCIDLCSNISSIDDLFDEYSSQNLKDINEDKDKDKDEEVQLHEQYAVNNNANNTSYIALITPLFMAFTGYAYVLYNYMTTYLPCGEEVMIYTTMAVLVVLLILHAVALEIGASQRSNQLVIDKIRVKKYKTKEEYYKVFPKGYNSFGKNYFTFVQGIYNTFSKTCFYLYTLFCMNLYYLLEKNEYIALILQVIVVLMLLHRCCLYTKYKERYDEKYANLSDYKCWELLCYCITKKIDIFF